MTTLVTPLAMLRRPQLRRELIEARAELAARRERESALRTTLEAAELRLAELRVAYAELLAHTRATAAAAAAGELAPAVYVTGHLEEIGLQPAPDAVPEHLVAEGLAVAARLEVRR